MFAKYPFSREDDLAKESESRLLYRRQCALDERWEWMLSAAVGVVAAIAGFVGGIVALSVGETLLCVGAIAAGALGAAANHPYSVIVGEYRRLDAEIDRRKRRQMGFDD